MKTWHIDKINLLERLSQEELALFQSEGSTITLERGQQVDGLEAPGEPRYVYLLTNGYAKLATMNEEGKRFSIAILQAGSLFGRVLRAETLSSGEPDDDEFLEALSEVRLLRLRNERFASVLQNNASLTITVLQMLQGKSRYIQRKLTDLLFKDVYARIAQLFLELVYDMGRECPYAFGLCRDLNLRHHEIAELIGASRPVTSMALSRFIKADLIHKHDGLICLNHMDNLKLVSQQGLPALEAIEGQQNTAVKNKQAFVS